MTTHGIGHYNLRAPRALLEQLRDFYRDVIGLTEGPRPPFRSFGYWLYAGTQDVLHLTESRPDESRDWSGRTQTSFDHVAFRCSGLIEFRRRLEQGGIAFEIDHVRLTSQTQVFLRDPAGNGVELGFAAEDPD